MGTNYYYYERPTCPTCHREFPERHIGKSSAGWCFALHIYPDDHIYDLEDWQRLWSCGGIIKDEYGREITLDQMIKRILHRSWQRKDVPYGYPDWPAFHVMNYSEDGPHGLLRSVIDGRHCVGHGNGTYDLFMGEFS